MAKIASKMVVCGLVGLTDALQVNVATTTHERVPNPIRAVGRALGFAKKTEDEAKESPKEPEEAPAENETPDSSAEPDSNGAPAQPDGQQAAPEDAPEAPQEPQTPDAQPPAQGQAPPPEAVLKLAGKNLCEGTGETVLPGQTNPVPKATADTCAKAAEVAGEKEKNWGPKKDGKMPLSLTPPIPTEKQAQVAWFKSCCEESKEDAGSNSC
mmetsp:Transcript_27133/g.68438  ORF Transcript_27133/g.68438 Transcript_27133/m.68438 type:complete len:211 (+) Transcript_27133:217-849(+)